MEHPEPLLSDEQAERLMTSFAQSRLRKGKEFPSEEECIQLLQWATLAVVNWQALELLFAGELEIEEFFGDDIQFMRPDMLEYTNPLMYQLMEQVNERFEEDSKGE